MKRLGSNLILLFATLAVMFVILEISIRLFIKPGQQIKIISTRNLKGSSSSIKYPTPAGWRLRPNIDVLIENHITGGRTIRFKTNSLGLRGQELGPKNPHEKRILILGDSIMLSDYAQENETIPFFLEEKIGTQLSQKDIKVINGAIGGIALDNEIAILKDIGPKVMPDLVLVGLYLNDAKTSLHLRTAVPHFFKWSKAASFLIKKLNLVRLIFEIKKEANIIMAKQEFAKRFPIEKGDWKSNEAAFNFLAHQAYRDWGLSFSTFFIKEIEIHLSELINLAQEHNFRIAVTIFPVKYQVEANKLFNYPQKELAKLLTQLEIPYLDLLPVLRAEFASNPVSLFYDQCHLHPEGNKIIGENLSDFIVNKSLLLSNY